jgi:hypothetical protein
MITSVFGFELLEDFIQTLEASKNWIMHSKMIACTHV